MSKPRRMRKTGLPKGSYPWPSGGYATESVGPVGKRGRRLKITAVHRDPTDVDALARVLVEIAREQQIRERDSGAQEPPTAA